MIVSDYLVDNFAGIMEYDFTANVEKDFDSIADGKMPWDGVISDFYTPFHSKVQEAMSDRQFNHIERELGTDPADGKTLVAKFGQFGPYVQKGDPSEKMFASLGKGQLIETITLEEAIKLFQLPRVIGEHEGVAVEARKGRFGAYLKYGDRNVALPKGVDPLKINLEKAVSLINEGIAKAEAAAAPLKEWESGIVVMNGRYGPYIKFNGNNYRIPKNTDAATLTEEACKAIIEGGEPTGKKYRHYKKK